MLATRRLSKRHSAAAIAAQGSPRASGTVLTDVLLRRRTLETQEAWTINNPLGFVATPTVPKSRSAFGWMPPCLLSPQPPLRDLGSSLSASGRGVPVDWHHV